MNAWARAEPAAGGGGLCQPEHRDRSHGLGRIEVPDALGSWHRKWFGEEGGAWIHALPDLAASLLDRWQLRPDGRPAAHDGLDAGPHPAERTREAEHDDTIWHTEPDRAIARTLLHGTG